MCYTGEFYQNVSPHPSIYNMINIYINIIPRYLAFHVHSHRKSDKLSSMRYGILYSAFIEH